MHTSHADGRVCKVLQRWALKEQLKFQTKLQTSSLSLSRKRRSQPESCSNTNKLIMTCYFGKSPNLECATSPLEICHAAKKEVRKKKEKEGRAHHMNPMRSFGSGMAERGEETSLTDTQLGREGESRLAVTFASWQYGNRSLNFFYTLQKETHLKNNFCKIILDNVLEFPAYNSNL